MSSRLVRSLTVLLILSPIGLTQVAPVQTAAPPALAGPCRSSLTVPLPARPNINCAAPPETFDSTRFFSSNDPAVQALAGPTFDAWAWASFAAFNWPAKAAAAQPTSFLRGVPDTSRSFANAASTDVVVWETFKEKREVFTNSVTASTAVTWQDLTYPPDQEIKPVGGQIPACTPQDALLAAGMPGQSHRRILQGSKLAPALATGAHALDETAEVASPAQETQAALCAGYAGAALANCQSYFPVPPGGGPTTPFPPTILNPRAPVGPRVLDPNGNIVFYEVRVNYDYFNYVVGNGINLVPLPQPPTPGAPPPPSPYALPWRTSAKGPPILPPVGGSPSGQKLTMPVMNYNANATVTTYGASPSPPPPVGSVQVKSAWKKLKGADPTYHTTQALYFETTPAGVNRCFRVGTFGLIGLHIIQRVHNGTSAAANADPLGGTFIFATWEHNSIVNGGGYSYVNFLAKATDTTRPYPAVAKAIRVRRQQPYPLASTARVTAAVYAQLPPRSVWRNYRLVGTQFYLNVGGSAATSARYNQPFYLANLVIETNSGLQNFQGLPPNVTPIANYASGNSFQNTGPAFNPLVPNVSWKNGPQGGQVAYNMGGCMGCHGVAQLKGANFSFVLLDGQGGAGIDTSTSISIPP